MAERADIIRESIHFLHRYMVKSIQKNAEEYGLTAPQLRVIAEVLANESLSIKQLTKNLRMTQSTVSDIVERLSARDILLKTPNPKDKRSVNISVSKKILSMIKESTPEPVNRAVKDVLSLLEPSEQEIVEKGMCLLVKAVKEKMEKDGIDSLESYNGLFFPNDKQQEKCE